MKGESRCPESCRYIWIQTDEILIAERWTIYEQSKYDRFSSVQQWMDTGSEAVCKKTILTDDEHWNLTMLVHFILQASTNERWQMCKEVDGLLHRSDRKIDTSRIGNGDAFWYCSSSVLQCRWNPILSTNTILCLWSRLSSNERIRRYFGVPSVCCDESIRFFDEYHDFRLSSFQQLSVVDFYFVRDFLLNTYSSVFVRKSIRGEKERPWLSQASL